ncbi:MAG TPA: HlyD family efflux transporter periplasmic adaptor subunit [Hymenobacter sp.]
MKKLLVVLAGVGAAVWGSLHWTALFSNKASAVAPSSPVAAPEASLDSTFFEAAGVVGAGGAAPVLANATGRVRKVYFTAGEYARRGQVLAKLYNYTCVVAPRAGFLGPRHITVGQYLTPTTTVTTISRRSHLVVSVSLPAGRQAAIRPGDSAQVWVASRPARVERGLVAPFAQDSTGAVEIFLPSRAPFRIGEQARVRLKSTAPQLTMQ